MVDMSDGIKLGVAAIIGIVAVAVVFGLTSSITVLSRVVNETLDLGTGTINGTTTSLAHYPLDGTALTLIASTKGTPASGTNYTLTAATGTITWASAVDSGNITKVNRYWNASYQYQPSGYVSGTNATIVNNYTVLLLLGVLAFVGYFVAKTFNILG